MNWEQLNSSKIQNIPRESDTDQIVSMWKTTQTYIWTEYKIKRKFEPSNDYS